MFNDLDESAQHKIIQTFSKPDKKTLYKYIKNNAVAQYDKFKELVYEAYATRSKTTETAFGLSFRHHRSRSYYYPSR